MPKSLIVDDSATVRRVVRQLLQQLGHETEEAGDGREALTAAKKSMPDLVILDWNMPEMDGLHFLKSFRKLPGGSKPVVIFCTTVTELERIEAALDAGADEYIMKPFDEEILHHKLAQTGLL